jgi:hypothetical protein
VVPDFIDPKWFTSLRAYNLLKVLPWLYRRYAGYEFMLTYELDAWVFRDELLYWCEQGWDYIGAPWFKNFHNCNAQSPVLAVGNSGFSLRRISAIRRALRTMSRAALADLAVSITRMKVGPKSIMMRLLRSPHIAVPFELHHAAEDQFWCFHVARLVRGFRIAPYEVARHFAFEANPLRLFEECGERLPFGCHKPLVLAPEFWRSRISSDIGEPQAAG